MVLLYCRVVFDKLLKIELVLGFKNEKYKIMTFIYHYVTLCENMESHIL